IRAVKDSISLNLNPKGQFIIQNEASQSAVTIDSEGNATFKGTITAERIRANQIEGLEIMTDKISTLSKTVDGLNIDQKLASQSAVLGVSKSVNLDELIAQASSSAKLAS